MKSKFLILDLLVVNGLAKIEQYDYILENFRCMNYLVIER